MVIVISILKYNYNCAPLNAAMREGILSEDYYRNKPILGNMRLKDFVKEFAAVYNQQ
jgi:hypothetical protein